MKLLAVTLLGLVAAVSARSVGLEDIIEAEGLTAYDYHNRVGIPLAEKIRAYEEKALQNPASRITGGSIAADGQHPYQVGLLIDLARGGTSVCGGSIINAWRVLTAAHCWLDWQTPARQLTVVAGSTWLFSGGQRPVSNNVATHHGWNPAAIQFDIAVIRLPWALGFSGTVGSIPLITSNSDLAGTTARASGFGGTGDGHPITQQQRLSWVDLPVISNAQCGQTFGNIIIPSTLCCSGAGGRSTCGGDSGGPLTTIIGGRRELAGVVSFGAAVGCQRNFPVGFARVSYFRGWIQSLM